jgi:hypothetical protein
MQEDAEYERLRGGGVRLGPLWRSGWRRHWHGDLWSIGAAFGFEPRTSGRTAKAMLGRA